MTLLFVLEHYDPYIGGAEKLFKQLAESMASKGHKVQIITTQFKNDLPKFEILNRVEVHRVQCYNRFLFTVFSLPKTFKLAKHADLIQTTTYNAALPAWIIGKIRKKKVFITFHELWGKLWFKLPYLSLLQRWAFYLYEALIAYLPFDHYIAVSDATKNDLIQAGISAKKISRIHNGIEYEKFAQFEPLKTKQFTAIYYGRLGVSKGLDLLIPAWNLFGKKHPNTQLQLVIPKHPDNLFKKITALIDNSTDRGSITLFHHLEETKLFQLVANADVVVIPSYKEGFCFVAAESMAIGTPIISSGLGALKEVVNGKFLEMKKQDIESLHQALINAYRGRWKETTPKTFTLDKARIGYANLYESHNISYKNNL